MAGEWLKMREDLHEDPAVLFIAQELDVRPETVVGYCHRFWGIVSRQTSDGCLARVRPMSLDFLISVTGFCDLLTAVGWLDVTDDGINVPKFERHLSESSKRRLDARRRKEHSRKKKPPENGDRVTDVTKVCDISHVKSVTDVTVVTGLEERIENKKSKTPCMSPADDVMTWFVTFWEVWPNKVAKQAAERAWKKLSPSPELVEEILAAIEKQKQSRQWLDGIIPHPATWLNGRRWEDEVEVDRERKRLEPGRVEAPPGKYDEVMRRAREASAATETPEGASGASSAERSEEPGSDSGEGPEPDPFGVGW